jgi:hypothetical protein
MQSIKTSRQKWEIFREEVTARINEIDKETPWSETEPEWWLQMMEVQKLINKNIRNNKKHE